ncbi:metallo-oxidoreductase [Dictyobacter alpinus]|uniref:Metallo-oxidoreductase n=1 Tax=Dictyobacter alpinus TaxID=2014873 RepID=A0A402BK10_9CHLR|nr:multicopper oxidase family protein [Dictyobacter alpinus]GCE31691.1 metallo-oxidoreductase [Dictyobacter alpinus]
MQEGSIKHKGAKPLRPRTIILLALLGVLLIAGGYAGWSAWSSQLPERINMGSDGNMTMPMGDNSMPMPSGPATPIASFKAPETAAQTKNFTLTARTANVKIGNQTIEALTYNGTAPGPTLRVQQGDLVVVKLVNTLSEGITIHWHGVAVPNSADGVAGVTQNAVKKGETYTYRFIAKDAGTYWYHSHQQSNDQVKRGLFGMLIVDPKQPAEHDDVDAALIYHDWSNAGKDTSGNTIEKTVSTSHIQARPGAWVHLRLLDTDNDQHMATLIGAPFTVTAMDGADINKPQPLSESILSVGSGQRYDLRFQMPAQGAVRLVEVDDKGKPTDGISAIIGDGNAPTALHNANPPIFDFTHYGQSKPDPITADTHFDNVNTMKLDSHFGFFDGSFGSVYTINGKSFPDIPPITVKEGQLVKISIINEGTSVHPIHLHGHDFSVLSRNGKKVTGSPIYLDTINIQSKESYEIGFRADNPGLWMDHCHDLDHASHGMDMMVVYPNISTPFDMGKKSGNIPE